MNKKLLATVACTLLCAGYAQANDPRTYGNTGQTTKEENTAAETQQQKAKVADDQINNTRTQNELIAAIRSDVVEDDSLSTAAHNITILSEGKSRVRLRGSVANLNEKNKLVQIAKNHATEVVDNLSIRSDTTDKDATSKTNSMGGATTGRTTGATTNGSAG